MELTELQIRFANEIAVPFDLFLRRMAGHPMALDAGTNQLLHQFEGLVLALNHFPELNRFELQVPLLLRDSANSIKHIRGEGKRIIDRQFATIYEHANGKFRFVRNTVVGTDASTKEKCDLVLSAVEFANAMAALETLHLTGQRIYESVYGFFDWAFSINDPKLAVSTAKTRIMIVEKVGEVYEPRDLAEVKYVVFGPEFVGIDPSFAFPYV